jgi:hypothetical protein
MGVSLIQYEENGFSSGIQFEGSLHVQIIVGVQISETNPVAAPISIFGC